MPERVSSEPAAASLTPFAAVHPLSSSSPDSVTCGTGHHEGRRDHDALLALPHAFPGPQCIQAIRQEGGILSLPHTAHAGHSITIIRDFYAQMSR